MITQGNFSSTHSTIGNCSKRGGFNRWMRFMRWSICGAALLAAPDVAPAQPATPPSQNAEIAAVNAEMNDAIEKVKVIINQKVGALRRTPDMKVSVFSPGWFHDGATKPNFNTVDVVVQRVSLSFSRLPDSEFSDMVVTVVTKMTNNPSYPNPVEDLQVLAANNNTFVAQIAAAAQGGTFLTAQKDATRALLDGQMRALAAYVDSIAKGDLAVLLSSGFKSISTDRTRQPLVKPTVLNIDNFASTQLMLKLSPVRNARSYEVRIKQSALDWKQAGIYTKARGILLEALTPGQVYEIQARAVGGTTGYSDWSDPVSRMVT